MEKSRLNTYCQKNKIELPTFRHIEQGEDHCKKFKAIITLQNKVYEDENFFKTKKEAENYICGIVLLEITKGNEIISSNSKISDSFYLQRLNEMKQKKYGLDYTFEIIKSINSPPNSPIFSGKGKLIIKEVKIDFKVEEEEGNKTKKIVEQKLAKQIIEFLYEEEQRKSDKLKERKEKLDKVDTKFHPVQLNRQHRKYQEELYEESMKNDIICYLPTGTGKTLCSCLTIKRMHQKNPNKLIIFLVDRIPLVIQQSEAIRNETSLNTMGLHSSNYNDQILKDELNVIVIIAELFINLLKQKKLEIDDISLVKT